MQTSGVERDTKGGSVTTAITVLTRMKNSGVFRALSEPALICLAKNTHWETVKKNECLWQKGQKAAAIAVIQNGLLELSHTTPNGEDSVLGLFGPGDALGVPASLRRGQYFGNAKALGSSVQVFVIKYPLSLENEKASVQLELTQWFQHLLLVHEEVMRAKVNVLIAGSVEAKLIALFEHLHVRFGSGRAEPFTIPLSLTKTFIAKYIDSRIETVIRTLNKWESHRFFQMGPKGIKVLDSQAFEEFLYHRK